LSAPPLTPLAAAVLHVPVPERALVVNCGEGEAALFLAREFPAARIRGADSAERNVRAASGRVGLDPEGRVAFKQGSSRSLPYPDEFFDLVAQQDGWPAAAETARLLRPGGHLILTQSRPPRILPGARERLRRARLARHGIAAVRTERAGDGNFLIARLETRV
jgi:ubiquinone/menaquinone biosynthesis C-methylase UbiE